jgi:5-(carboxyamino)imidazole ribonucleotide mutase
MQVSIIMGSISDDGVMQQACDILDDFGVNYEKKVLSAHRTPDVLVNYVKDAVARGVKVIIAGAGGAAHLPGVIAAFTTVPVIGVPIKSRTLNGLDSLPSLCFIFL